jgi:hypothetical protein
VALPSASVDVNMERELGDPQRHVCRPAKQLDDLHLIDLLQLAIASECDAGTLTSGPRPPPGVWDADFSYMAAHLGLTS